MNSDWKQQLEAAIKSDQSLDEIVAMRAGSRNRESRKPMCIRSWKDCTKQLPMQSLGWGGRIK